MVTKLTFLSQVKTPSLKKQAELCDIELSDDEQNDDSNERRQHQQKIDSLKAQLNVLLRARL